MGRIGGEEEEEESIYICRAVGGCWLGAGIF